jgi:5-hydroxyisourate hydrolase-like protein (transthyretin family)
VKSVVLTCGLMVASWPCLFASVAVNSRPRLSARNIQITALVDGKPKKGARIDVCRYKKNVEEGSCFSMMTDVAGQVATPTLPSGDYGVVASYGLNLVGNLLLRVPSRAGKKVSAFSIDLVASQFPTWQQQLTAADKMPVKENLQHLNGVVLDPSGTEIANVTIEVVRKGSEGKDRVARLKTAKDGRFSEQLRPGQYLGIFQEPGFSTKILPFELTEQGTERLQVTLQIAPSAQ